MLTVLDIFSGFSVNDLAIAKQFYTETLNMKLLNEEMGLRLELPNGAPLFIYQKDDHVPASYTILNLVVANIDEAVDTLISRGIYFEHYNNLVATVDEKGILRGIASHHGPDIAWFKDPAGNTLSILQTS